MKRRHFLVTAGAAASQAWAGANDRVRVAIIGVGGRGGAHIREILPVANTEIAALVDPDGRRTEEASSILFKRTGKRPKLESDLRRVFDDKEIDAVSIAATNHWHSLAAIWAMQAGKDVFCEKPACHNVWEGYQLIAAARKYKRISAGCTQRRWWGRFRKAVELVHAGAIGDVYQANFFFAGRRNSIGFKEPTEPPGWLNWDLWLGAAPMQPHHENLVHYNWHWFWDFGNGELGNNGIHYIDVLRWGMRKELPVRIHATGGRYGYKDQAQTPNTQNVTWVFEDGSKIVAGLRGLYTDEPSSWDFFGTEGHIHIQTDGRFRMTLGRNKEPEPEAEYPENINHMQNFYDAVRARNPKLLHAEIAETVHSASLCHLGNIAYRLGRELTFDPARRQFPGDAEANRLLTREYRAPYVVPQNV
jgi:predicted dehydrogenase